MEDKELKLYPFALESSSEQTWWGTETWHLADLGFRDSRVCSGALEDNTISEVMETYLDRVVGDGAYGCTGRLFPVMVKTLATTSRTPLLVCPDDLTASERYDSLGKAKIWYIRRAAPGACIYIGLKRSLTATEFYESCLNASVIDDMNMVPVREGDCFLIAPGILHCAGDGVTILEISESSDLDLRLCNWGRTTDNQDDAIFLEEAFDFICMEASTPVMTGPVELAGIEEFKATLMSVKDPVRIEGNDAYAVYHCLSGSLSVQTEAPSDSVRSMDELSLREGGTIVVPADIVEYCLVPTSSDCRVIEVTEGVRETVEEFPPLENEEEE